MNIGQKTGKELIYYGKQNNALVKKTSVERLYFRKIKNND